MDILSFVLGYSKGKAVPEINVFPLTKVEGFRESEKTKTYYYAYSPTDFKLKGGETYYVKWDGTKYTCKAVAISNASYNYVYIGDGNDTPFVITSYLDSGVQEFKAYNDTKDSHDIRIYQIGSGGGSTADERVKYVTFMYGETELIKYPVIVGDTVKDVVTAGIVPPLKEPTVSEVYPLKGWSLTNDGTVDNDALANVTENRTVYAILGKEARKYTVKFYDGETLLQQQQVAYGATTSYQGSLEKEGYVLTGWTLSDGTAATDLKITADTNLYAAWEVDAGAIVSLVLPSAITGAYHAKYSPDGTRLFFVYNKVLYMYDTTTQPYTLLKSTSISSTSYGLDISPDGKWLAVIVGSSSTMVKVSVLIFDISNSGLTPKAPLPQAASGSSSAYCRSLSFSADSSKLAVYHGYGTLLFLLALPYLDCQGGTRIGTHGRCPQAGSRSRTHPSSIHEALLG